MRGDTNLFEVTGVGAYATLASFVPSDLASWQKHDRADDGGPLSVYAEGASGATVDVAWPEASGGTAGVVEPLTATNGSDFFVLLVGILDHVQIEARAAVTFDVLAVTGALPSTHTFAVGEMLTLNGAEALVLRGSKSP